MLLDFVMAYASLGKMNVKQVILDDWLTSPSDCSTWELSTTLNTSKVLSYLFALTAIEGKTMHWLANPGNTITLTFTNFRFHGNRYVRSLLHTARFILFVTSRVLFLGTFSSLLQWLLALHLTGRPHTHFILPSSNLNRCQYGDSSGKSLSMGIRE